MSGAGAIDGKTHAVWGDAIIDALRGDRSEIVELLNRADIASIITPAAAEFIGWLIVQRKGPGRPALPEKFRLFQQMKNDPAMFAALDEIHQRRLVGGGKLQARHYEEVARMFDLKDGRTKDGRKIPASERLEREDRRCRESVQKIGY